MRTFPFIGLGGVAPNLRFYIGRPAAPLGGGVILHFQATFPKRRRLRPARKPAYLFDAPCQISSLATRRHAFCSVRYYVVLGVLTLVALSEISKLNLHQYLQSSKGVGEIWALDAVRLCFAADPLQDIRRLLVITLQE
jgi:hypothetical protein